jgi:hypothetical protein
MKVMFLHVYSTIGVTAHFICPNVRKIGMFKIWLSIIGYVNLTSRLCKISNGRRKIKYN